MSAEYDLLAEEWRKLTRRLLAEGSDNPDATAADVRDQLENLIEEENEDAEDDDGE